MDNFGQGKIGEAKETVEIIKRSELRQRGFHFDVNDPRYVTELEKLKLLK